MPYNAQISEEATEWFISFCEGEVDEKSCAEFNAWLRISPEHVAAYLQISAFWEAAGTLHQHREFTTDDLVRAAAAESNVLPLLPMQERSRSRDRKQWRTWQLAFVASLVMAVLVSAYHLARSIQAPVYTTAIGEQRTLMLSDGSAVTLNARSRIRVQLLSDQRLVELLEGQAMFRVAKNPARPFMVRSGAAQVEAVGTQFDVDRMRSGIIVTVVEGSVTVAAKPVSPSAADEQYRRAVSLAAGQQVTVATDSISVPKGADVSAAMAWTQGKLVFDSASLADVVETFNRYNRRQLVIDTPELLEFHLSGTFATTDTLQIVNFIQQRFRLKIEESDAEIRLSR